MSDRESDIGSVSVLPENEFNLAIQKIALDHCYAIPTKSLVNEPYASIMQKKRELKSLAASELKKKEMARQSKENREQSAASRKRTNRTNSELGSDFEQGDDEMHLEGSTTGKNAICRGFSCSSRLSKASNGDSDFDDNECFAEEPSKGIKKRRVSSSKTKDPAEKAKAELKEKLKEEARDRKLKEKVEKEKAKALARKEAQLKQLEKARIKQAEKEQRELARLERKRERQNELNAAEKKKAGRMKSRSLKKEAQVEEEIDVTGSFNELSEIWLYESYSELGLDVKKDFEGYFLVPDEELERARKEWTAVQITVFDKVIAVINSNYLLRLAQCNEEFAAKSTALCNKKGAEHLRSLFGKYDWNKNLLQWCHQWCLELLTDKLCAIYLDIMRVVQSKVPVLFTIGGFTEVSQRRFPNADLLSHILRKGPPSYIKENKGEKAPSWQFPPNSVVILGPSVIPWSHSYMKIWAKCLALLGETVVFDGERKVGRTKEDAISCVEALCKFISDIRENFPSKNIILVGQFTMARLACFAALEEKVKAIVCLGYPFLSPKGILVKEPVLRQRCPVFFILGSCATSCPVPYFQKMCKQLKAHNSVHVVVGGDDFLRIPYSLKYKEHVLQYTTSRNAVVSAGDFLEKVFLNPDMKKLNSAPEKPPPKRKRKKDTKRGEQAKQKEKKKSATAITSITDTKNTH